MHLTHSLVSGWAFIAAEQTRIAIKAQDDPDPFPEFKAALIAINACAFALDGLHLDLPVADDIRRSWPKSVSGKAHRRVAETLTYAVGGPDKTAGDWDERIEWLIFRVRHPAVHAKTKPAQVPVATQRGNTSIEYATYTAKNADSALALVIEILAALSDSDRVDAHDRRNYSNLIAAVERELSKQVHPERAQ